MGVYSELFDNRGVRANGGEEVLGHGGGIYVPVVMRDLSIVCSPEQEAKRLSLWGGVKPGVSEEPTPGSAGKLWDSPKAQPLKNPLKKLGGRISCGLGLSQLRPRQHNLSRLRRAVWRDWYKDDLLSVENWS